MSWHIYDTLRAPLPRDITVTDFGIAPHWAWVRTSDGHIGMGAVYPGDGRPVASDSPVGMSLHDASALITSWNFAEAGVGLAAMNAWYNRPPVPAGTGADAFAAFARRCAGKRVGVVGHFPGLEKTLHPVADVHVFERVPRPGDYPDSAAEFLLPTMDAVFITASALVNKTLPRLLELCPQAWVALVGPSAPLTSALFDAGVNCLSGFIPTNPVGLHASLRGIGGGRKWDHGVRVNVEG